MTDQKLLDSLKAEKNREYQNQNYNLNNFNQDNNWAFQTLEHIVNIANNQCEKEANSNDYRNSDGLLICGKCGCRKQDFLQMGGRSIIVPCMCNCQKREEKAKISAEEEKQKAEAIDKLKSESLITGELANASFEKYYEYEGNKKAFRMAKKYVDKFDEMRDKGFGLLFWGKVGTGKSFTAACIANALLDKGYSVIVTSFVKILQNIQESSEEEAKLFDVIKRASLVVIDDLGVERDSGFAVEKIYNVIDTRLNANLPLIITTNLTLEGIKSKKNKTSERRLYDRILEMCDPIEMTGNNFRENKAKGKQRQIEELLDDSEEDTIETENSVSANGL